MAACQVVQIFSILLILILTTCVNREINASREKSGVYLPKERYYQEELERKAMAEEIIRMEHQIENQQKKFEELQTQFNARVEECSDLSNKLGMTQNNLNQTTKMLVDTEETLKKCQYALKEREFVILEQKKAENALAHQACVLRSDLEKSLQDNASLFMKIAREDKLNAGNRSVVNKFESELAQDVGSLCNMVAASLSEQNEQLQCIEKFCDSFIIINDKAITDFKKKVSASRNLYVSHIEDMENVVRLHKASANGSLEEIFAKASSNANCIETLMAEEAAKGQSIFDELQGTLSKQQGEIAVFARELRKRFDASIHHTTNISEFINGIFDKLTEESKELGSHANQVDETQTKNIDEFQKAYEEQSRSDAQKLIADVTSLVSSHISRQKEMVDARLAGIRETAAGNKTKLDGHVSSIVGITSDAKRKWQEFSLQAEDAAKDNSDFSAAKHCRVELLLQKCVDTTEIAKNHSRKTHESVNDMGKTHVSEMEKLVRGASESNELHDAETHLVRETAEMDLLKNCEDIIKHMEGTSEEEREAVNGILEASKAQALIIENLRDDHTTKSGAIEQKTHDTFQQKYMDYKPSGTTPVRCDTDVPSKITIELLRAMPMETLMEEFRENHPLESLEVKDAKISPSQRSPLTEIN